MKLYRTGEEWFKQFESNFGVGVREAVIVAALSTIAKIEREHAIRESARVAAAYDMQADDKDEICHDVGREILRLIE